MRAVYWVGDEPGTDQCRSRGNSERPPKSANGTGWPQPSSSMNHWAVAPRVYAPRGKCTFFAADSGLQCGSICQGNDRGSASG